MGLRSLSEEFQARAIEDLNEDPDRREKDIEHIKEWLKKQPHLNARMDDQWLLTFLRGCKFSLERTKEKLDAYYTLRTALPEYFKDRDPMTKDVQDVMNSTVYVTLPKPDFEGRSVMLIRPGTCDPSTITIESQFKVSFMHADVVLQEDDRPIVCGEVTIIDLKDVTLSHAVQMTPSVVKKLMVTFQDGYPMRPQGVHYVNVSPRYETVINIFKAVMKEKIKKRLRIHTNMETLYEYVPKSILPTEYGGDGGSIESMIGPWKKRIESYKEYFKDDEQYCSIESKRPGKPKTQQDLFGLEGSFRQLSVD